MLADGGEIEEGKFMVRSWLGGAIVALVAISGAVATPAAAQIEETPYFEGQKLAWTYVSLSRPTTSYWNASGDAPVGLGVKPVGLFRSFFRLDTSKVSRTHILNARLATFQNSGECKPGVELWLTGEISEQTTWVRQPSWIKKLGTAGCPGQSYRAVTDAVTEAAARGAQHVTFGLKSADETDLRGRSVFETEYYVDTGIYRRSPKLMINFNTPPAKPPRTALTNGDCYVTPPEEWQQRDYAATTTPTMVAEIVDPDEAGTGQQYVFGRVEWRAPGGAVLGDVASEPRRSGQWVCAQVPAGQLSDGGTYEWRIRAEDGIDVSEWTEWQKFTVDATRPESAPDIVSTDYPEEQFSGGVGVQGTFTFTPHGVTDVVGYAYGFGGSPSSDVLTANSDGSLTFTFTPDRSGPFTLSVVSVDRAGHWSPQRDYMFFVN
ncbi:hypothetical protein ACIBG8_49300 [Nonomuraea sp. NPDC050556]|uniref:hypothetical protein n=1 Tax=Nonomuraea sp. NPDC050556 TaxID=3364369 RepID=UPI00379DA7CA